MTLTAVATTTSINRLAAVGATDAAATGGGQVSFGIGSGAAGAYIAQGSGPGAPGGSLAKKMIAGGVIGAGLGFAASFIPGISFLPHPKILFPAIGAALGAIAGGVVHFFAKRKATLAMDAQAAAQQQQTATQATQVPVTRGTLKLGTKGPSTKTFQSELKTLGLFDGKVTGTYDARTATAVRKYEVMQGVPPTGVATPDVRTAIKQHATLIGQYV
ncbi:MAG: peptidoglycan binding domain protein [Thermoleophilia bacterium]|jgi:hypothetical protein|nr:peptidoglycan binding domain protein [Thermoleophilia bacterium]